MKHLNTPILFLFGLLILFVLNPQFAQGEVKILFLGNSLTEGFGVPNARAYPSLIQNHFLKMGRNDVKVMNAGISGSTSASAYSRLKWYLKSKPDILVLVLGGNDGLRGLSIQQMIFNLSKTIQFALHQNMKVLLAGMLIPPNYGPEYTRQFKKAYPDLAKRLQVNLIPFLMEGVAGHTDKMLPDGIHPNVKGHEIMALTVLKYLKKML